MTRVEIHRAFLDDVPASWFDLLPTRFLERCRAMADPLRGRRRAAARAFLHVTLAAAAGIAPEALRFETGPNGKPFLPGGPGFNLADSDGVAVLAICPDAEVGIDIERIRPLPRWRRIAERFLGPGTADALSARAAAGEWGPVIASWCRFEAWAKAGGTGILRCGPAPAGLHRPAPAPGRLLPPSSDLPEGCRLVDLDAPRGFRGALVVGVTGTVVTAAGGVLDLGDAGH